METIFRKTETGGRAIRCNFEGTRANYDRVGTTPENCHRDCGRKSVFNYQKRHGRPIKCRIYLGLPVAGCRNDNSYLFHICKSKKGAAKLQKYQLEPACLKKKPNAIID